MGMREVIECGQVKLLSPIQSFPAKFFLPFPSPLVSLPFQQLESMQQLILAQATPSRKAIIDLCGILKSSHQNSCAWTKMSKNGIVLRE
jgi:hypothetical protein